jgi:hypothetical protein
LRLKVHKTGYGLRGEKKCSDEQGADYDSVAQTSRKRNAREAKSWTSSWWDIHVLMYIHSWFHSAPDGYSRRVSGYCISLRHRGIDGS